MWRREGLKQPQSIMDANTEYKGEMDVLAAFVDACCVEGGEADAGEVLQGLHRVGEREQ